MLPVVVRSMAVRPLVRVRIVSSSLGARHASSSSDIPIVPPATGTPAGKYDPQLEPQLAEWGYPKLSTMHRQHRKPLGWSDRQDRANFGEPVAAEDDMQSMWAVDQYSLSGPKALRNICIGLGAILSVAVLIAYTRPERHAFPRAYPYDGLVKELSGTDDPLYATRPASANDVPE